MFVEITTRRRIMRQGLCVLLGILLVPTVGLVGDVVTDGKFKSTVSTGAPLEVASDYMVANLNADMVDGVEGTDIYSKAEIDTLIAAAVEGAKPKSYYLTNATYSGSAADGGCGAGYHMASLWEISDPSNLRYAYEHEDAWRAADAEDGPPSDAIGWIRTGWSTGVSVNPGQGNCDVWSSASPSDYGTIAVLSSKWNDPAQTGTFVLVWGTPWAARTFPCDDGWFVWCIED
jgi:hypothetical protein